MAWMCGNPHYLSMVREMEETRKLHLHSLEEIRMLLHRRIQFEIKINSGTTTLRDLLEYIRFEKLTINDINVRKNKVRNPPNVTNVEFTIRKRIMYLYEIAIQNCQDNYTLHILYFRFCMDSKNIQLGNRLMLIILKRFSDKPEAWQEGATWYTDQCLDKAITILMKGLDIHRTYQPLYLTAITLEIRQITDRDPDRVQPPDYERACRKLENIIQCAFTYARDFSFFCDILRLHLENHTFTMDVQNMLIKWLLDNYSSEHNLWHILAQREHEGLHYENTDEIPKTNLLLFRVNKAIAKYEEGLTKVTDKKFNFWVSYINYLLEVKHKKNELLDIVKLKLQACFEAASKEIEFTENFYIEWAKVYPTPTESGEIIDKGLKAFPDSVRLWKSCLQYTIMIKDTDKFNEDFKKAIHQLKDKALSIWYLAIDYHTQSSDYDAVERIYLDAIRQPDPIAIVFRPNYLEWLFIYRSLGKVRRIYKMLCREKPYCDELHETMICIEEAEDEADVERLEECFKLACEQFSHQEIQTRINLMQFYMKNYVKVTRHNPTFDYESTMVNLYKEGCDMLKHNLVMLADFKERVNSLYKWQELHEGYLYEEDPDFSDD